MAFTPTPEWVDKPTGDAAANYLVHLGEVGLLVRVVVVVVVHARVALGVTVGRLLLQQLLGLFLFRRFLVFGIFGVDVFDHFLRVFRRRRFEVLLVLVFRRFVKVRESPWKN